VRFLEFLGQVVIPRQRVTARDWDVAARRHYLEQIHGEHRSILEAIDSRSAAASRAAMRTHLTNSLIRYRGLSSAALERQ
jgi:GntR family transcriptional repressor for pyruvate dehydrogenase complex